MQKSIENQPRPSTRVFVHGWHLIGLAALGSRPAIYIDNHVPTRRALDIKLLSRHSPRYSRICNYAALRESVHHSTLAFLLFDVSVWRCVDASFLRKKCLTTTTTTTTICSVAVSSQNAVTARHGLGLCSAPGLV
jgi:hypothetical protein